MTPEVAERSVTGSAGPGWSRWRNWSRWPLPAPGDRPAGATAPRPPGWQRVLGGVLVAVAALEAGVLECFWVPVRIGGAATPVAMVCAVVGNVLLTRAMYRATGSRLATAAPVVIWLGLVLVFAAKTAEGDLVVPGTWPGLLFLFGGTVAGAVTLGRLVSPRTRH